MSIQNSERAAPPIVAEKRQGTTVASKEPASRNKGLWLFLGIGAGLIGMLAVGGASLLLLLVLFMSANQGYTQTRPPAGSNGVYFDHDGWSGRVSSGTMDPNGQNHVIRADREVLNLPPY